jgi:hypothetical protein
VDPCAPAQRPTCQSGEWMCPPYQAHTCDAGRAVPDASRGDAAGRDATTTSDGGLPSGDGGGEGFDPGDGAAPWGDASFDGGADCNVTGCATGFFCVELGRAGGATPPFVCEPVPLDCVSDPTCDCLVQHHDYSCPPGAGWSCSAGDGGVVIGCVAP